MSTKSESSEPLDPIVGRRFGDFVVEERIGEGSFGAVYRATQPLLGRLAALKVLHKRLAATAEITDRFLREARTASSLDHPYAAHVYASGAEPDGTLWIGMEYVRGTPLSDYLSTHGPLPLGRLVPFLERVCEVVHGAHEHGIVHRDIKPANIMVLSRSGRLLPKLLDFGIAKALAATVGDGEEGGGEPAQAKHPNTSEPAALEARLDARARQEEATGTGPRAPSAAEIDATAAPEPRGENAGESARASEAEAATRVPSNNPGMSAERPRFGTDSGGMGSDSNELTRRGEMIGSPAYMAPEQWSDAASVDARCDLYALGVVAYEALTGRRPFPYRDPHELARAHKREPPPPVPEGLPSALDDVFARALAKDPDERFDDALAFVAAFRSASGVSETRRPIPRIDEALKDRYLADAPRPIADAVAALDAAEEPRHARDALWGVADVLSHYVGLLAVCARSRFGALTSDAAPEALRRAGAEVLSADAWLDIALELSPEGPGADERAPMPELFAFVGTKGAPAEGVARLRELEKRRGELASAATDEDTLRERLRDCVTSLSAILERARFLCDYPLVVLAQDGRAELWTGVSRRHVPQLSVRGADGSAGEVLVLDAEGTPVLSLHPLVKRLKPAPEAPRELFLFAGGSPRGGRLVAVPLSFERRDEEPVEWLRENLATRFEASEPAEAKERSPYRGLEAYDESDAELYVGREREIDEVANRLRREPFLAVVGPSGAGKSSFVQAGVLPALHERGEVAASIALRPGMTPVSALTAALTAAGLSDKDLASRLRADASALGEALRRLKGASARPVVVVVDQFEEVFTLARDREERRAFAAALMSAASGESEGVRVIITLRDDFLVHAEGLEPLKGRLSHALQLVTTPSSKELERIVEEPAKRAGYAFEDPDLPARMVAEVEGEPGALALLSFTAAALWDARDRHFRRLPTRAYEELGGVAGALSQHAEGLLESLPQTERRLVREAFRLLVTGEGTRAVLGREELARALGGTDTARAAVEHLVAGRLLVVSEGEAGEQIEIAHEALLHAWPRLVEWRREDAEGARFRDQLRAAAVQWDRRARPKGLLWRDDALAEYRRWRARYPGALTDVEQAFADASLADERRSRRRRRGALAVAFAFLSAGLGVLFVMHHRAEEARGAAEEQRALAEEHRQDVRNQLLDSYLEQGSRALQDHEYFEALLFLSEAFELGADGPEEEFMLSMAAAPLEAQMAVDREEGLLRAAQFSPDGTALALTWADGRVLLVDGRDAERRFYFEGHEAEILSVSWAPDGELLAAGDLTGKVQIWRRDEAAPVASFEVGGAVFDMSFGPRGERVFVGTMRGDVRAFSRHDGETPTWREEVSIDAHRGTVRDLDVRPDGRAVATAGDDGRVRIWDVASGALRRELDRRPATVQSVEYDPAGARLLGADHAGGVAIWDTATGERVADFEGHSDRVNVARFDPEGERAVTASHDGSARVWDVESGEEVHRLGDHRGYVTQARFRRDGREILTSDAEGTPRRWDAASGALAAHLPTSAGRSLADYSPDGSRVVTWDRQGKFAIWATNWHPHRALVEGLGNVVSARFGGGSILVIGSDDGAARVWDVQSDRALRTLEHDRRLRDADIEPGESAVVKVDDRGVVTHMEVAEGARPRELTEPDPMRWFARFDGQGELVAVTGEDAAVYSAAAGDRLFRLNRGDNPVLGVTFAPASPLVLAGKRDGSAELFDAETGEPLQRFEGHTAEIYNTAIAPDEALGATASSDGTARVWDLGTGETTSILQGHEGVVADVAFSPDGAILATAGADGTLRFWGAESGRELARFSGHTRQVNSVSFQAGGERVATAGEDGVARLWRLPRAVSGMREVRELRECLPLELRDGNPAPLDDPPAC